MTQPPPPTVQRNYLPTWLIIVGVPVAMIGGIIMAVASNKAKFARDVGDYEKALGMGGRNVDLDAAVTLGHWGLGVLILGVVIVLIGIAALAVKRSTS
jgi:hypothetical protein